MTESPPVSDAPAPSAAPAVAVDAPPVAALTIEAALWMALAVAAFAGRLAALARWPLRGDEAALANQAARFVGGLPYQMVGPDLPLGVLPPLAFNLESLAFLLFGAGDGSARLLPALGGALLVLAPWLFRPLLGRAHALGFALLLLVSPVTLFFGREATGAGWAALATLLTLALTARWLDGQRRRDGWLAAASVGLGLASAPAYWSLPVAAALAALWRWIQARRGGQTWRLRLPEAPGVVQLLLVTGTTFLLVATGFLTNPPGLGAAVSLPVGWLRALLGQGSTGALHVIWMVLLYEALPLLAALVALARIVPERSAWATFGLLWSLVTLLPVALSGGGAGHGTLLMVTVPLCLLGGAAVGAVGRAVEPVLRRPVESGAVVGGLILFAYLWINLVGAADRLESRHLGAIALALLLLVGLLYLLRQMEGPSAARRVGGLTLLLVLTIVSAATGWGAAVVRAGDPVEPLVSRATDPDLRATATQLAALSVERYRDATALPVAVQRDLGPAPRWYLRDFDEVTVVDGSHPSLPEAALLAPGEPAPPGTVGEQIRLGSTWRLPALDRSGWLHWLLFREAPQGILPQEGILYLRVPGSGGG